MKNSALSSELQNTSERASSLLRSDFLWTDMVLALALSGNQSQLANEEMPHVSGDSITGLLQAETFPGGHPLQSRNHCIAHVPLAA